jgi:RNA polymerase sigma-70 factor (ECF subfamily)
MGMARMAHHGGLQRVVDHPVADRPEDWAAVLEEHQAIARRALRSVLGRSVDEEDLLQEVALRLVVRLREPGEISLGAWTWRVAHNVAVDHVRKRRAIPADDGRLDRGVGNGLDGEILAAEFAATVAAGIDRLPERQRDALLAQASLDGGRGGHSLVAQSLGVSPKAAESLLARARRSLLKELRQPGVEVLPAPLGALAALGRLLRRKTTIVVVAAGAAMTVTLDLAPIPVRPVSPRATPALSPPVVVTSRPHPNPPNGPPEEPTIRPPLPRATAPSPAAAPTRAQTLSPAPGPPPSTTLTAPTLPLFVPTIPTVTVPAVTIPPLPAIVPAVPGLGATVLAPLGSSISASLGL